MKQFSKLIFAWATILVAASLLFFDSNCVLAKPVDDSLKRARELFSVGKFQPALAECSRAIELDSKSSEAYQLRGWALFYMGKPDKAISDLNIAVKLNPNRYENFLSRGEVLRQLDKSDDSRKDYDRAIQINPNRPDAYYLRGCTCLLQGLHVRAKQDFTDAIKRGKGHPYLAYAYYWRGRTAEMQDDFSHAVLDFTQSIKMDPGDSSGYSGEVFIAPPKEKRQSALGLLERGLAYSSLGEHGKAIDDLSIVIKSSPKDTLLYEKRGNAYLSLGKYNEALRDFNKALLLGTESGDVYYHLGLAHFCLKRYDNASADFSAWLGRTFWQDDTKTPLVAVMTYTSLKMANKDAKAAALAVDATKSMTKSFGWVKSIPLLLNGKTTPEQLISMTDDKPLKDKTKAHCYAALYFLAERKPKEALKQFSWVEKQGDRKLHEYMISAYEMKELSSPAK